MSREPAASPRAELDREARRLLRRAALGALAAALLAAGTFQGGSPADLSTQLAPAVACGLALLLTVLASSRREAWPGPASLAGALALGFGLLQSLPLPGWLLARLGPEAWALRSLAPLSPPAFATLSLDPGETLAALVPLAAVAAGLGAAELLGRDPSQRRLLLLSPVLAALLQASLALAALAESGSLVSRFANRNHLSALLLLGGLTALGAAAGESAAAAVPAGEGRREGARPARDPRLLRLLRVLASAAAGLCATLTLLTQSRGGAVGLSAGALVLLLLLLRTSRRRGRLAAAAVAVALVAVLSTALLLAPPEGLGRLSQIAPADLRVESRLPVFATALELALAHPFFGVGRGVFRLLGQGAAPAGPGTAFYYVENQPLQLAAELGLPAAAAIVGLAAAAWILAARRARTGLEVGALAGLLGLGVHELADFSTELLAVALPAALALGAVQRSDPGPAQEEPRVRGAGDRSSHPRRQGRHLLRAVGAAVALAAPAISWVAFRNEPFRAVPEGERLAALAEDPQVPSAGLLAAALPLAARHPVDWQLSLAPAAGLARRSPLLVPQALAWAARAQTIAPRSPSPHLVLASILARLGRRAQARLELRLAFGLDPTGAQGEGVRLALLLCGTVDELLEATPDDVAVRLGLVSSLSGARPGLALDLVDRELERDRDQMGGAEGGAVGRAEGAPAGGGRQTFALRAHRAHLLLRLRDLRGAEQEVRQLPAGDCDRAVLLAQLAQLGQRPPLAEEPALFAALDRCPGQLAVADLLVRGRLAAGAPDRALDLLDDPRIAGPGVRWPVEAHLWRAQALEALGRAPEGLRERWLAAATSPESVALGLDYAERLRAAGQPAGAIASLRSLAALARGEARARYLERAASWVSERRGAAAHPE